MGLIDFIGSVAEYGRERGDFRGAAAVARSAVRLRPGSGQAWVLFAKMKRNCAEESEIEGILRRGLTRTNGFPEVAAELVRSLLAQGKIDEARSLLQLNLRLDDDFWAHVAHARLAYQEGDAEAFRASMEAAVPYISHRSRRAILTELAIFLVAFGGEEQAVQMLMRALELGEDLDARLALAELLYDRQPDVARKHVERAREVWQGSPESFHEMLGRLGDLLPD